MNNASKKRVLMVIPSFGGGGAERVGVTLINSFDESKYDIFVITFEDKSDYFKDIKRKIEYKCLYKKGPLDFFRLVIDVRKIMKKFQPNIVISLLHYFNIVCGSAAFLTKKDFTLILCEHIFHKNFTEQSRLGVIKKMLMNFLYFRADFIVAISKQMKEALIKDFGINEAKIKVIYNPIPIVKIRELSKVNINHRFLDDSGNNVIISVGRLINQKRFDRLLRAFSMVKNKMKDVYLLILGAGPDLNQLKSQANELGILEQVDFVGFQANPYAWMAKADYFVLSSDFEGFPMVLLEAMACGLPVISTDCPSGPREIIDQEKNGILIPAGDVNALAGAMMNLLSNKVKRDQMSIEAFNSVDIYDQENIFLQYESLWN